MTTTVKSKSALELVLEWSKDRPLWMRDALRQVVHDGLPNNDAIAELAEICMAGQELCKAREAVPLDKGDAKQVNSPINGTGLTKIGNVEGVNQLAPNQEVKFGASGLTIIYGPNGSGKSGYTRILKRACNARHRGKIMPDAFAETTGKAASAQIGYHQNDNNQVLSWVDDDIRLPALQSVSIFDRDCAFTHLNQKNSVLFRPFGLDIPDDMVTVCAQVKEILENKKQIVEQRRDPLFGDPLWSNTSDIGQFLNSLTFQTDFEAFPDHPELSDDEIAELTRLQKDLASDPAKVAATYKQNASSVKRFNDNLRIITEEFSAGNIATFLELKKKAEIARDTAKAAAEKAFSELDLQGIGEPIWRGLWDAVIPPFLMGFVCRTTQLVSVS